MLKSSVACRSYGPGRSLFVCFGFLASSSTTRLCRGRAPRQSVWQFYVLPHMRQSWETMTSFLAGHIILTPNQPVGSGRPQRDRTRDLLTRSRALYRLSYRAPHWKVSWLKKFFWKHFFLVIGIKYYWQNHFQSFWAVKIFTFMFYEYSTSFIYMTYIRKNKLQQPFSQKVTNTI